MRHVSLPNGSEEPKCALVEPQDGYICVSGTLNGVRAEGYFNQYAEFVGTACNLFFNQLPITVMQGKSMHATPVRK